MGYSGELKVGDTVRGEEYGVTFNATVVSVEGDRANLKRDDGKTGGGLEIPGYGKGWVIVKNFGIWDCDSTMGTLTLLSSREPLKMNIKERFAIAFKSEPYKSFRKAGITDGDDVLTSDGQSVFLSWLLKENGVEFKKEVVDGILADEKKGETK